MSKKEGKKNSRKPRTVCPVSLGGYCRTHQQQQTKQLQEWYEGEEGTEKVPTQAAKNSSKDDESIWSQLQPEV